MKNIIKYTSLFILFTAVFFSCRKKDTKLMIDDPSNGELMASATDVVTDTGAKADEALSLVWGEMSYGDGIVTTNALECDKSGSGTFDEANTVTILTGADVQKAWTHAELNTFWIENGGVASTASTMHFRVKYSVEQALNPGNPSGIADAYSNIVAVTVTPYDEAIAASYLYVPGDYQGWNPAGAGTIVDKEGDGTYEGIIEFYKAGGPGSNEFKFTSEPSWNGTNYGAGTNTGELSTDGGAGNLMLPSEGTYMFMVDINALTWTYSLENWGLIGDAVPVVGWGADTNMVYNPSTNLYEITLDLGVGQFKFRKNDDWAVNLGSTGANDGDIKPLNGDATDCVANGKNFGIAVAGNYTLQVNPTTLKCYVVKN